MIVPYVWWHSSHDHRTHAFLTNQAMNPEGGCYEAACSLTVPTEAVVRRREGTPCTACLLAIGSALPQHSAPQAKPAAPARSG